MKPTKMKIEYCKQIDSETAPWLSLTNVDELQWNGVYSLRVSNDDGSHNLPFRLRDGETVTLVVKDHSHPGKLQGNRTIVQEITHVDRSTGCVSNYSRFCSKVNGKPTWSNWTDGDNNRIVWNEVSHIDKFTTAGIYNIAGERTNAGDGLPFSNSNPGHTFHARLVVLDSSINDSEVCVTQVLMLSNRVGGDGNVYVRTGNATSKGELQSGEGWEPWGKLQQNIEVGQTASLDGYIDNGIYSGAYTVSPTQLETFVMVVINNYAVAAATGTARNITQVKYAVDTNCVFSFLVRTGQGTDVVEWGSWVDLGAATTTDIQDGAITADKLSADIVAQINNNTIAISAVRTRASESLILQYGRNMFIKDDATVVGYIQPNGSLGSQIDWLTTEHFVNIKPNTDYKRTSVVTVAFYDIAKNFVKQVEFSKGNTFTSPSNAFFAKFSVQNKWTSMVSEADKWEDTYIVGKYPEIGTTAETKFSLPELLGEEVAAYKIATLGDSITQRGQWQEIIEHNCGFGFFNNGLAGRTVQYFAFHRVDGTASDYDRILVASDFVGVDAIVICGYANSLWSKIGSLDEEFITINAEEADADLSGYPGRIGQYGYVSALRSVIEYIMSICPAIPIILSSQLPMSRAQEGWNGATTSVDFDRVYAVSNKTCKDFAEATKEVAEHYHLPFVDLHNNGQVNIHNYTTYYDGDDTTHPNFRSYNSNTKKFPISGMRLMAGLLGNAIKSVI